MRRLLQSSALWSMLAVLLWCVGLRIAREPVEPITRLWPVLVTAWWATAFWVIGAVLLLGVQPISWARPDGWLRLTALTWLLGAIMLVIHVAVAFQVVHRWSLTAAYLDTQRQAGIGEGVYVNFLFALVWLIDAVWLIAFPSRYARRPRWLGWVVHGFLAFILFNATVVYGSSTMRWIGAAWFALLAFQFGRWWRRVL